MARIPWNWKPPAQDVCVNRGSFNQPYFIPSREAGRRRGTSGLFSNMWIAPRFLLHQPSSFPVWPFKLIKWTNNPIKYPHTPQLPLIERRPRRRLLNWSIVYACGGTITHHQMSRSLSTIPAIDIRGNLYFRRTFKFLNLLVRGCVFKFSIEVDYLN